MHVLALEPYYGGSHQAFLDGWREHSRHRWTLLTLPAHKWKWRMRHAAITFAEQVKEGPYDVLFCSDMLNLAEFLGLAPPAVRSLRRVVYFHENQLTYPVRHASERDYQFAFTNLTTALAADRVWFNTGWHRESFLAALEPFLKRMPDFQPLGAADRLRGKSEIRPQGILSFPRRAPRRPGPLRLLWAHRWEHDKDPETFFDAVEILDRQNVPFRLSVVGREFRDSPAVFREARERFGARIDRWGYQENRSDYECALLEADAAVSTARHEFFGVGILEAAAAGAFPVVPRRLAYPEVLDAGKNPDFFYDGDAESLAEKLKELSAREDLWNGGPERGRMIAEPYYWENLAPKLDEALERT